MKEKSIEIIAPEGYEVDKEKSSFEKIVFRALPDKGLPKTWGELERVHGYYADTDGTTEYGHEIIGDISEIDASLLFPTREEAEASIALAQLCQLRDRYNGGWKPDWASFNESKFCIYFSYGKAKSDVLTSAQMTLHFRSDKLCKEFLENFADLIEKAKPLL